MHLTTSMHLTTILLIQTGATNRHTHTQTEMVAIAFINTPARREGELEVRVYLGPGPRGRTGPLARSGGSKLAKPAGRRLVGEDPHRPPESPQTLVDLLRARSPSQSSRQSPQSSRRSPQSSRRFPPSSVSFTELSSISSELCLLHRRTPSCACALAFLSFASSGGKPRD